ncbi:MAG: PilZ domain-containing protein [Chloroflexi bacterium]|nr:PilZ domain-containing protein [Chloroflexota bacterium]
MAIDVPPAAQCQKAEDRPPPILAVGHEALRAVSIERRQFERLAYATPVHLYTAAGERSGLPREGRLRDFGAGGLCVVLPNSRPGALGSIVEGTVRLEMAEEEDEPITLHFGVQWKRSEPDGTLLFGVCFDSALADPARAIGRCRLVVVRL